MRVYGTLHPTENASLPPDITQTMLIASSSGQAMDWYSGSTSAVASASAAGIGMVRLSGQTTAGAAMQFAVNLVSTKAAAPSSGVSTEGTTGFAHTVFGSGVFQVPGGSTGFSVAALTSGYVIAELWRK